MVALALVLGAAAPSASGKQPPREWFGIAPQTELTERDARYMRAGGIGSIRWPLAWGSVQASEGAPFDWHTFDRVVGAAARHGLRVFPFLCGTPGWVAPKGTTLPLGKALRGWGRFVKAAVRRYGPGGGYWRAHKGWRNLAVRRWQVWNEANFFYFALPVSPRRYARLFVATAHAVKSVRPGSAVILSGLFGNPHEPRRRGMSAARYLRSILALPGVRRMADGVALHPYAAHVGKLRRLVKTVHSIARRRADNLPLFITEMGWGSQNDPHVVSFEQGLRGQARELRRAYAFLTRQRRALHIAGVYWFSWKDTAGACSFCDSAGLFYGGAGFKAKPAWRVFVGFTGGSVRP